jgi:hypothetical protein
MTRNNPHQARGVETLNRGQTRQDETVLFKLSRESICTA